MRDPDFQDNYDPFRQEPTRHGRRKKPNIWQKLSVMVEIAIYVLIVLIGFKLFSPELDRLRELEAELDQLERVRDEKEETVSRLRKEHLHIKSDRDYLEAIARDRLNLQKEGEYVIQIER